MLTRDGTAEPVSRDQILRRERGQGDINFPCSADHVQDYQPYPVDPYSCYMCDHTHIHCAHLFFVVTQLAPLFVIACPDFQTFPAKRRKHLRRVRKNVYNR